MLIFPNTTCVSLIYTLGTLFLICLIFHYLMAWSNQVTFDEDHPLTGQSSAFDLALSQSTLPPGDAAMTVDEPLPNTSVDEDRDEVSAPNV